MPQKSNDHKAAIAKSKTEYYSTEAGQVDRATKSLARFKDFNAPTVEWDIVSPDGVRTTVVGIKDWATSMGFNPKSAETQMNKRGKFQGYTGKRKAPE